MDSQIIVAVLKGAASPDEVRRLEEWRAAHPANERKYRQLESLWVVSGRFADSGVEAAVPSVGAIIHIAEERANKMPVEKLKLARTASGADVRPKMSSRGPRPWMTWKAAAIAASLVIGLGLGTLLPDRGAEESFGPSGIVTGVGETATTTLHDGTVVHLAPDTRLEFSGERGTREVALEGRAYFAVARQPDATPRQRVFRVRLPDGEVEVLGTRFDVEGRRGQVQVAVVEGEVRVSSVGGEVNVGANHVARSMEARAPEVEEVEDVYQVIDWLTEFLAFQSTPMDQVVEEMQRRFKISIEIEDAALMDREFTGWFAQQTPAEMIAGVCVAVAARCTVGADETVRMSLPSEVGS